jgi:adenylyltransferase/sulfurtransferase
LLDYELFCGVKAIETPIKEISTLELEHWISNGDDFQIIDVREPSEYEQVNIGAHLIPLGEILERSNEIDKNRKVSYPL